MTFIGGNHCSFSFPLPAIRRGGAEKFHNSWAWAGKLSLRPATIGARAEGTVGPGDSGGEMVSYCLATARDPGNPKPMADNRVLINIDQIEPLILDIRGQKVLLDKDLAALYGVPTRRLNEQVRRNRNRFPDDFMFQLTKEELENWKSQIATSNSAVRMGLRPKSRNDASASPATNRRSQTGSPLNPFNAASRPAARPAPTSGGGEMVCYGLAISPAFLRGRVLWSRSEYKC